MRFAATVSTASFSSRANTGNSRPGATRGRSRRKFVSGWILRALQARGRRFIPMSSTAPSTRPSSAPCDKAGSTSLLLAWREHLRHGHGVLADAVAVTVGHDAINIGLGRRKYQTGAQFTHVRAGFQQFAGAVLDRELGVKLGGRQIDL